MKVLLAWRLLTYERGRTALVVAGIFVATLLMFLQLAFYAAVPKAGALVFEAMPFDVMLTSAAYVYQGTPHQFPRRRLYQAVSLPEVAEVAPLYIGATDWLNIEGKTLRGATVLAYAPDKPVFDNPDIMGLSSSLSRPDTVLVDSATRKMYGPLTPGRFIELNNRRVEIGGIYVLGTGFVGLAVVVVSDVNFQRIFPNRRLYEVNMGLVRVTQGVDADDVAEKLRKSLPPDTRVFTRAEFFAHEQGRWTRSSSAGLIFGFGAVVAMLVGMVILYQMLATQVSRDLPQYATLKAMGYTDRDLSVIVVGIALLLTLVAFPLALVAASGVYVLVEAATLLPVHMTVGRGIFVFLAILAMASGSALLATGRLRAADPADNF